MLTFIVALLDVFDTWMDSPEHHKTMQPGDRIRERLQSQSIDPESQERDNRARTKAKVGMRAKWAARRITIVQEYEEEVKR